MKKLALTTGAALLACSLLAPGQAARAQQGGVNAGIASLTLRYAHHQASSAAR